MTVGFYYMANAAGRLVGTLLGGALYEFAGTRRHRMLKLYMVFRGFVAQWIRSADSLWGCWSLGGFWTHAL